MAHNTLNLEMVNDRHISSSVNPARQNGKLILLAFLLDMSGSMNTTLDNGISRYSAAVNALIQWLKKMSDNETFLDNLCITIHGFNGLQQHTFIDSVILGDIDIPALEKQLCSAVCTSNTPLGESVLAVLERFDATKKQLHSVGTQFFQPIVALLSDDESQGMNPAAVDEAAERVDALLEQKKLVMLPVGIGNPGTHYPNLNRFLAKDTTNECGVLSTTDDMQQYFRYLGMTVLAVEAGHELSSYSDWLKNYRR